MRYLVILDKGHGKDTAGKRTPYIEELGRSIKEYEFNMPVVAKIKAILERDDRIDVAHVSPEEHDVSLKTRTDRANNIYNQYCKEYGEKNVSAIFISVHFNAYDGSFGGANPSGISVFSYPNHNSSNKLADSLLAQLKNGTKQVIRGAKYEDFWVLRKTHKNIAAALTENGFMDYKPEALLMLDEDFQNEVANEHVNGIYNYFDLARPKIRTDYDGHWAKDSIEWCKEKGYMNGFGDTRFGPDEFLTRAQFATVLKRIFDK